MLVLENAEHAMARNARIYAEIAGVGHAADHRSAPEGAGMGPAMRQALANAGLSTRDVDYVNAHAPSDPHMDAIESTLIKEVFNGRAYAIPVTSIKGATGCPMGAAGVQQIVTAALVLEKRIIPPTTNFEQGDTSCDLDYVPLRPRSACVRVAIVNSHGFGRSNASIVLAKGD